MIGRSNTNVIINGPTLELNSEYFSYPNSSLQPTYTKNTSTSCVFTDFSSLPSVDGTGTQLYKEYLIYRIQAYIDRAFTIDFTPVKWKYRKVTVMGYFYTKGTVAGQYNMDISNNGETTCSCPTYTNATISPYYLLEIDLETDPVLIISGNASSGCDVSFRLTNCIGYFR